MLKTKTQGVSGIRGSHLQAEIMRNVRHLQVIKPVILPDTDGINGFSLIEISKKLNINTSEVKEAVKNRSIVPVAVNIGEKTKTYYIDTNDFNNFTLDKKD